MSLVTKTGKYSLHMNDTQPQCSEQEEVYRLTLNGCGMAIEEGRLGFVNMEPVE